MKKLTILLFCLLSIAAFSQVARNKVVVEIGTGTWCPYCPWAAQAADALVANGFPVAILENHGPSGSDPFANVYSTSRNSFYNIPGYPTAWFDGGNQVVGGSTGTYNSYVAKVNLRMNTPSPVDIFVWGTGSGTNYSVTAMVVKLADYTGTNPKLHLAITESNIQYSWQGQTHLEFVNRLMVPDQNGTVLDFSESNILEIPLTFSTQPTWPLMNLELVAFVQTISNKEILNGFLKKMFLLPPSPPPLTASFETDTTSICADGKVQFTDLSTVYPNGWSWEFPGGTPSTSTEQNPLITYETPGTYSVTLTVNRNATTHSVIMENYIQVNEAPEVTFGAIEDQCINYEPFELTQGLPAGGTYTGPGVEDGFFHPDVAGIGTHTLTYTYTTEFGCEDVAEQTVVVDACTGVPENGEVRIVTLPNPTQGVFKLTAPGLEEAASIRIMNSTGKTVFEKANVSLSGNAGLSIDLSGNSSGIYYINVEGKNSTYYKKIILQK